MSKQTDLVDISQDGIPVQPVFKPVAVTGATPSLDVGSYNYFDNGTLNANTTVSFANVPTNAKWSYNCTIGIVPDPWDVSASIYLQDYVISAQETNPRETVFKPDGTAMYVAGNAGDDINEYSLSTAWDVSTASYVRSLDVSPREATVQSVSFKTDGTKMYIVGSTNDNVSEYNLSTAWNISTATYSQDFSLATQDGAPTGLFFKPDGTKMFITGVFTQRVYMYTLSTAWDISTLSISAQFSTGLNLVGISFKDDGTKMYLLDSGNKVVREYNLSTAWTIGTGESFVQSFDVSGQDGYVEGVCFKPDGTKMYITGMGGEHIIEYDLGIPPTLTLPASVVDAPSTTISTTTVNYDFITTDGGTTVSIVDNTPQSTAAGAVGTYTFGRPANLIDYSMGDTATGIIPTSNSTGSAPYYNGSWVNYHTGAELSGTWRCMSEAYSTGALSWSGLWVRIS